MAEGGWSNSVREFGAVKKFTDVTGEVYSKARNIFYDVKAKIKGGEERISVDKAVEVLKRELAFPDDRALNFVARFNTSKQQPFLDLSATDFNNFVTKISEIKQEIIPAFQRYDADHNGQISLDEATKILGGHPFNFPSSRVDELLRRFDKDHNGMLNIEEFAAFYAEARISHEEISACFDQLDKDGNGVLSPDEVLTVIQDRMKADRSTAEELIKLYDRNQDGNLDKTEFMVLWSAMFGQ